MKKVLITGANSYIGTSFEEYIKKNYPDEYVVDTVDMIDGRWREKDFSEYDCIFHVAGIAHQKETKENADLYYKVNCDLAVETAQKAKREGVKHFIFLSSMSVYGIESGVITKETVPNPVSNYGKSKYQAEETMADLIDQGFRVAFVRPPMVYGENCRGNFQTVVKIVKKFPVFPRVKNKRSMIYIDTLCEFVKYYIDNISAGVLLPQNKEYMNTSEMAKMIADKLNKKIYLSIVLGWISVVLCPFVSVAKKAFGTLVYEKNNDNDQIKQLSNSESVKRSV